MIKIVDIIGVDGLLHFETSALLVVTFKHFLPWWAASLLAFAVGILKELYDKISGTGCAELKDIICDAAGVAIGALL